MVCVRAAWLTLGTQRIDLEDQAGGWFCQDLDLGSPDIREVTNARPDADGIDDRTRYYGGRAVTAAVTTLAGAGARIDDVASRFSPFMVPSARPVLHYVLDRPGTAERTLVVRAAGYGWPIAGDNQRDIQLAWIAADPIARDPVVRTATAWAGGTPVAGRTYPLTFPRIYPSGGGAPTQSIIHSSGDLPVQPLLRIYGPILGPVVTFQVPGGATYKVGFLKSFMVGAGAYVDVSTNHKSAYYQGDPNQNVLTQLDWPNLTWPVLPPGVDNTMNLSGGNTTASTQAQASWQDGYLS